MENLLNIANEVLVTKGFDPKTDKVDDFEKLPDGEYSCLLEEVKNKKSEKTGTEWIEFKFSILDGEHKGRYIWVNYYFSVKTAQRSIRALKKLAYDFGFDLTVDSFASMDTLASTLNGLAGNVATVKQTTKNDFSNYSVTPQQ